ncbi:mariner Mos1 transposase [Trichonephila clavipes]|nr:mariner Mos1 transposase [Trichonephila clavipes]
MNDEKINLKFCFKLGKTPKIKHCVKCVYKWIARFRESRNSVSDNSRSGRPVTFVSDVNIVRVSVIFFDSKGTIHKEFPPEGMTMNAAKYIEVLTRFMKCLRRERERVRPQYAQQGSWCIVHDNARLHTANIVKQFLAKMRVEQSEHYPYSPDLNPSDFFLFRRLKLALKGKKFDDIPDVHLNMTRF